MTSGGERSMADFMQPPPPPSRPEGEVGDSPGWRRPTTAQKRLIGFIVIVAIVSAAYRLVYATGLQQTAALFVGIPALFAILLTLLPRSTSATGMLMKGSLIGVLLAGIILPEGLLCLLFAYPLLALIAAVVGGVIDWARSRQHRQGPTLMAISLPLLLLSLEGVIGSPVDPHDRATSSVVVEATPDEVARALARTPTFDPELPFFLTLGFNKPVRATGSGIAVGDERLIEFTGGTHDDHPLRIFGGTGEASTDHHSTMHLKVVESAPGRVVFAVEHDMTMLARWAKLDRAVVTWSAVDATSTRVTWSLEYERLLFPSAYFGPLERYGMSESAGYLLDSIIVDQVR
jgi:hypothetical protein